MTTTSPKLKVINGHAYANSLDLAKHFHKRHDHVVRDIRNIISSLSLPNFGERNEFSQRNFAPRNYKNRRGQTFPFYELTRDAFALVAMGFTGERALQWKIRYINAFNEMETELNRRLIKDREFTQLKFHFPDVAETIEDGYPSMTVSYAIARLTELGLMIPPVSRNQLISLIKRGKLQGFNDGRQWNIFADSFNRFVKMRSGQFA